MKATIIETVKTIKTKVRQAQWGFRSESDKTITYETIGGQIKEVVCEVRMDNGTIETRPITHAELASVNFRRPTLKGAEVDYKPRITREKKSFSATAYVQTCAFNSDVKDPIITTHYNDDDKMRISLDTQRKNAFLSGKGVSVSIVHEKGTDGTTIDGIKFTRNKYGRLVATYKMGAKRVVTITQLQDGKYQVLLTQSLMLKVTDSIFEAVQYVEKYYPGATNK